MLRRTQRFSQELVFKQNISKASMRCNREQCALSFGVLMQIMPQRDWLCSLSVGVLALHFLSLSVKAGLANWFTSVCELKQVDSTSLQVCDAALLQSMHSSWKRCRWLASCVSEEVLVNLHPSQLVAVISGGQVLAGGQIEDKMVLYILTVSQEMLLLYLTFPVTPGCTVNLELANPFIIHHKET